MEFNESQYSCRCNSIMFKIISSNARIMISVIVFLIVENYSIEFINSSHLLIP